MEIYTILLDNVTPVKLVTAKASYGIGFLTSFVGVFCALFGMSNNMYSEKIKKAETLAMQELETTIKSIGADGVMDVRCQIDGLSFLITGTAYKWSAEERAKREAEANAKHEAELKAQREATEKARQEAEEKAKEQSAVNTPDSIKKEPKPKEAPREILPCPQCGEDLSFMGWDDTELHATLTCPLCGKEILLKQ